MNGQECPIPVFQRTKTAKVTVFATNYKFAKQGQSGIEVSELLPGLSEVIDDVAVIRSGVTDRIDHDTAQHHFVSGRNEQGFPAMGSWATYGLGSENQNLPGYVALYDSMSLIGPRAWSSGWLPPVYQGVVMQPDGVPMYDLNRPASMNLDEERKLIDMTNGFNQLYKDKHPEFLDLDARISNFELAARMQIDAMKLVDFSKETEETKRLYCLDQAEPTRHYGMRCLLARRLVESGVRFVQLTADGWDHHGGLTAGVKQQCARTDMPIAGLLKDLKRRGLLESTLMVWGGEFGRLPVVERSDGRDHNPYAASMWMAGAGIKGGAVYGATDEFGYKAVENPVTHSDMHATILHLLGIDVRKLTYDYDGRAETLIGVNPARVLNEILA
jgi:hypothetical protein